MPLLTYRGPRRKKIPAASTPKKTINSINSIKWFFGVRTGTRKAEKESMHDLVVKQRAGRPRESPERPFKLPNPTGKWHLMGIDISRGKISIGVSATIYTISAVVGRHTLSGEVCSLWGGCCQLPLCDSYKPRFKTWVRIRYFAALSIHGPTARRPHDLRGSKVFAKRALESFKGRPTCEQLAGCLLAT